MRWLPRSVLCAAIVTTLAGLAAGSSAGFAIDKSKTFLGGLFPHGTATNGIHETVTATAIRRGMKGASANLIEQIRAGVSNVDVTHHFDGEYHFDGLSVRTRRAALEAAFDAVQTNLRKARPLADRNPEFFDPSYESMRALADALARSMLALARHPECKGCASTTLRVGATTVGATLVPLLLNKHPDPHRPTSRDSVFASTFDASCGFCGALALVNQSYRAVLETISVNTEVAVRESHRLPADDPLRQRIGRIERALDAYEAFQLVGHAFHATQDFFAHSNYVELMAGVAVERPIARGTVIRVPARRADFSLAGMQAILSKARLAQLETGASNAIWLGQGDYCLGSLYNPGRRFTLPIPRPVARALGLPAFVTGSPLIGQNPGPPEDLATCHYHTRGAPGINKDEPGSKEPSHVNHAFAVQAATDMTAVLWKSFLSSIRRPVAAPGKTPRPVPPPAARPGPWHGDWAWSYRPDGGFGASPGVMTMFQPSASKVCLEWPWSPLPGGKLGHGQGSTAKGARTFTFAHTDAFGSGSHTLTLAPDGKSLAGTYTATAAAGGAKVKGTVSATYVGAPARKLAC